MFHEQSIRGHGFDPQFGISALPKQDLVSVSVGTIVAHGRGNHQCSAQDLVGVSVRGKHLHTDEGNIRDVIRMAGRGSLNQGC